MSKKNRKRFTAEEIQILKMNRNTAKVSQYQIYYTEEFYRKALDMYLAGYCGSSILVIEGYDLAILGQKRAQSLTQKLRKMRGQEAQDGAIETESGTKNKKSYQLLKAENAVLKQQLAFLKKVISVKTGKDSEQ